MTNIYHSHEYDDEPPISTDENGGLYPYGCQGCWIEHNNPYHWTKETPRWMTSRALLLAEEI